MDLDSIGAMRDHDAPLVSVCIANFNGANLLADCIESVLSQRGNIPTEIIVHDDASTDQSVAMLRERYPGVHLIASEENVGFCVANNRMVTLARGTHILLLNNDAALFEDALKTLLEEGARQAVDGIFSLPQYDWETGGLVDRGCFVDPFLNPVPNREAGRQHLAYVIGACMFMTRRLWMELGGFPDWFGSIAEDMYLCFRARLAGFPVVVSGASGYRHRQGASFGGNRASGAGLRTSVRRRQLSERNKSFVMVVFTPSPLIWLLLPLHGALLVMEGLILAMARLDLGTSWRIYGFALVSLWSERQRLAEKRREVQEARRLTVRDFVGSFRWVPQKLALLWRHGLPKFGA